MWRRYATGFHQPQGAEVVDGTVYVLDRNQITRLHDLDGDGEADFYENFNNDFLATHHFHEFTFDLDRDADGNFYFAKAARHALPAKVDHHGVIMKLDPRGEKLEVVCRGFRVPNGVAVGPGGEITTSDQEGHWIPSTPIVMCEPGGYYGYAWGGGLDPARAEDDYDRPITYIPIGVDNSGGGQAWVPDERWGPFDGHLVHASFGRGKLFLVLMERVDGVLQGGAVALPLDFDTGLLRPAFRKKDGQLYVSGLYGWGTRKKAPGGFYRVRYEGGPLHMPSALQVSGGDVSITFTDPLDRASVEDLESYVVRRWNYRRSSRYGSDLVQARRGAGDRGRSGCARPASPRTAAPSRSPLEDLKEVDQMQLSLTLRAADGAAVVREISHTINRLSSQPGEPVLAHRVPSAVRGSRGRPRDP